MTDSNISDDVLEENQACKEENERLMDIIDEDIKALKGNLSALEEVVDHNEDIMTQIGQWCINCPSVGT